MANERLARRYAIAMFSLAQEAQNIDQIGGELRTVSTLIDSKPEFREFYRSPILKRAAKSAAILAAFEEKVQTIVLHTLLLLIDKRREALLSEIATCYEDLLRRAHGREALTITSARPLGTDERTAVVERLSTIYQKTFDVCEEFDPRLIGGLRIQIGDRRIDGTLSGRIEDLAASLEGPR